MGREVGLGVALSQDQQVAQVTVHNFYKYVNFNVAARLLVLTCSLSYVTHQ